LQYVVPCLGTLAEAVNSKDIDGMYFDIVCQLLEAIFRMQEMEETETSEDDGKQLLGKGMVTVRNFLTKTFKMLVFCKDNNLSVCHDNSLPFVYLSFS